MIDFWRDERGVVTVDWVVLTGGALMLALGLAAIATRGVDDLADGAVAALSDDRVLQTTFAFGSYVYLSSTRGTEGWQATVEAFSTPEDFFGWLASDYANAMNPQNDQGTRMIFCDDYATTYAIAFERGLDLKDFAHPTDLRAYLVDEFGL